MENEMYEDELEQFLKDEVNDHRMYPSDQIWRNIQTEVNGHQTWPALTFISIFIISALTISTLISNHPATKYIRSSIANHLAPIKATGAVTEEKLSGFNTIATEEVTAKTLANLKLVQVDQPKISNPIVETPVIAMRFSKTEPTTFIANLHTDDIAPTKPSFLSESSIASNYQATTNTTNKLNFLVDGSELPSNSNTAEQVVSAENNHSNIVAAAPTTIADFQKESTLFPLNIVKGKNSKFGFGFFVTPSTSYRILSDSKAKEILGAAPATAPVGLNYTTGINNIVRHKPAVGLELGFAVLYNMTNRLKFKTGIQFNIRQYYIETFQTSTDITTISLVNNNGIQNISVLSPYNNNTGYKTTELDNKMYQVSIPIGFQYDIIKGKHLGITAEASIQPTFTLNKTLYLLSTDYKHYADGNSLMRKWNINSSFGINITYKSGVYQWYLGPQARFQHLPTYSNKYPITEYLMDYGIRLGFIKQIK